MKHLPQPTPSVPLTAFAGAIPRSGIPCPLSIHIHLGDKLNRVNRGYSYILLIPNGNQQAALGGTPPAAEAPPPRRYEWSETWSCQVDDDYPNCGLRYISPETSEDADGAEPDLE